ncbi:hypothetical protein P4O66_020926, partial [Electrophorus voltai]
MTPTAYWIKYSQAQACNIITSITSASASSLLICWNSSQNATNYFLDLRVNSTGVTGISPVVVTLPAYITQKEVFGLRSGTFYTVAVKVFQFYRVACMDTQIARTVPDASQLNTSKAISSTAIMLEWQKVLEVDQYFILVNSSLTGEHYNLSFTGTSGVVQNLRSSTTYDCCVVTSNTAGQGARSRMRTVTTQFADAWKPKTLVWFLWLSVVMPPVVITVELTGMQTVRIRWQPVLLYRVLLYNVTVTDSRGLQLVRSLVSSTFLDVQNILPCNSYQISVSSVNMFLEPGESNSIKYSTKTPSPVTSISVDYSCASSSATVSWGASDGAISYRVVAHAHDGTLLTCSSVETSCQLTGIGCSGYFTVQVISVSSSCESQSNASAYFQTVPCAPGNLQLYHECISNVIIFSWAATNNTDYYTAVAVDSSGMQQECLTTDTSCFFTNTMCGHNYSVSVYSISSGCHGVASSVMHIKTAPCKPTNVQTTSMCQLDTLVTMWDASAGALYYVVEGFGNHRNPYNCSSVTTSCTISGMLCGESLTIQIIAFDDECYSVPALGVGAETGEWQLHHGNGKNVSAAIDCASDSLTITWMLANGALFYIVTVTDAEGAEYTCVTEDLRCQIKGLQCGSTYNASVISTNFNCNSSASATITVETAPCQPSQVQAALDCSGNRALISWQGPRGSFTATLQDKTGALLSCSTMDSSCWVPDLKCSQVYDVTVTYHTGICPSKPSQPIYMKSVPCGPQNVHAQVDCATRAVHMAWNQSDSTDGYVAGVVATTSGSPLYCNSTSPSCDVSSLPCSDSYTVQVQSYSGTCLSLPSSPLTFQGVPCVPTNVTVSPSCSNSTVVTWQASHGARSYRVTAVSYAGYRTECSTNGTSCNLTGLHCGQVYDVSVSAMTDACSSPTSQNVTLQTAPCAPTNVHGSVQCTAGTAALGWDPSPNAVAYTGRAVGTDGHAVSCSSSSRGCQLVGLRCGQDYKVWVTATSKACASPESDIYIQSTAPCAPQAVSSFLHCDISSLSVSWAPDTTLLNYSALARPANGTTLSCISSNVSCDITGLQCGQAYSIFVTATNRVCTGPESLHQTVQTAPCGPTSVHASVTCASNTVSVWWGQAAGALSYTGVLAGPAGYTQTCSTSGLSCSFGNLACAEDYKVHVVASDRHCNSTVSQNVSVTTVFVFSPRPSTSAVPCDPDSVSADLQCGSGGVIVSWHASAGASTYTALAYGANQTAPSSSCLTAGTSCTLMQLACGTVFNVSVLAGNTVCNSSGHVSTTLKTAPCPPLLQSPPAGCMADQANVSWAVARDETGVSLNATSVLGHSVGCGSAGGHSCLLQGLQCGQEYTVRATTQGPHCSSVPSPPLSIVTGRTGGYANDSQVSITAKGYANDSQGAITARGYANDSQVSITAKGYANDSQVSITAKGYANDSQGAITARGYANDSQVSITAKGYANDSQGAITARGYANDSQAPCTPPWVTANYTCASGVAVLTWARSLGAESLVAQAEAADHAASCSANSSLSHCTLSSLLCGRVYNVSLQAEARQCNSSSVATTQLQTVPCVPQGLSVSLQCTNNTASVSWLGSSGAVGYIATAVGRGGDTESCRTLTTSCQLPGMRCAQVYDIVVTPFSNTCNGSQSKAVTFNAGPCPPTGVQVNLVCVNSVASVSWLAAPNAEMYIATATAMDGQTSRCTTSSTTCSFLDLSCGKNYTVSVVTMERGCPSDPSAPVMLRSALCPPKNLASFTQCSTENVTLTWDPSPEPGVTYFLFSQQEGGANATSSTVVTSMTLTGLRCGMVFAAQVAAQDDTCTSHYGSPLQVRTAPCPPSGLVATAECGTNMGHLSWVGGAGALLYIGTLVSDQGHVVSCTSISTSCVAKLECNHRYTASVVSSSGPCNSSANTTQFSSAPCLASNIQAQLDCASNALAVQWAAVSEDAGMYTAVAIGNNGTRASCNANSTSCTIRTLQCGRTYGVAVTTSSIHCDIQGSDYQVQTVPCQAQRPSVSLECRTNVAMVTWTSNGVDQLYRVSAVNFTGGQVDCVSNSTNCSFSQFHCGDSYTLTVTGVTQQCKSLPSSSMTLNTAPCVPAQVTAIFDCNALITTVMWDMPRSADSYVVYAVSSEGDRENCTSTDTSCVFQHLPCGQTFSITVVAQSGPCTSLPSQPVTVMTGPCPHSNPGVSLDCNSDSAVVSWTPGVGVLFYNVSGLAYDVGDRVSCSTAGSACNLTHLQCAVSYQISIAGQGRTCLVPDQPFMLLNTAPCPPTQVSIQTSCRSSIVSVSWVTSRGSVSYLAVAQGSGGHQATCSTNSTACDIAGLRCGQTYAVHVSGVSGKCVGPNSETSTFKTAPCVPQNVQTILPCQATVLNVTWQQTGDATSYHAVVQSSGGQLIPCDTDRPFCAVPSILCGQTYSVVAVVAKNEICNSTYSIVQTAVSAPCPPQTVSAVLDCRSNTVSVAWSPSVPGVRYVAQAVSPTTAYACNSTAASCNITVPCGTTYNVSVTPVQSSCTGAASPYRIVQSAPCAPVLKRVQMDCLSGSAWVIWGKSAGGEFYAALATDDDGQQYACNSSDSTCAVDGLPCGSHYNFSVTAYSQQCHSGVSNLLENETAPCAPLSVYASVECANGTSTVHWAPTAGAVHYTATLESSEGIYTCCGSHSSTSCEVSSLPCGNIYLVTVIAAGNVCNSSESMAIARTGPCTPPSLSASLNCNSNAVSVSWTASAGGQVYTVHAVDEEGFLADSCDGFDSSCDLSALACGHRYTATVVAQDSACASAPSRPTHIKTVPCVPENVSVHVGCSENSLSVSWQPSAGATFYTARVLDSTGHSTSCSSIGHSCEVAGLSCGNVYHTSVVASDPQCRSKPTDVVNVDSVPCPPSRIQSEMDCQTGTALLSWQPGAGGLAYTAMAVSASGHNVSCGGFSTNCELFHLACGNRYKVSVQTQGQNCSSFASMDNYLDTGPCSPQHFSVHYSLSIAQFLWDDSTGVQSYTAVAVTPQGHSESCSSWDTTCTLSALTCGQTYNVTVTANSHVCPGSAQSAPLSLDTEPCPPTDVRVRMVCCSMVGVVSWEPSMRAHGYVVTLEGRQGDTLSCQTNETFCNVSGVQCGTAYVATVWAIGSTFNSSRSVSALLTTGPCLPDPSSVAVAVNCDSNTASVRWAWSNGASSSEVTVTSNDGYLATCASNQTQCNFTNLLCGQTYNVSMVTINGVCQVPWSTGLTFQTWPCVPKHMEVNLECGTSTAMLTWEQRLEVMYYQAQASMSTGGASRLCNSSTDSCQFSGLQCGADYTFSVRAFGHQCHSEPSSTVNIRTVPGMLLISVYQSPTRQYLTPLTRPKATPLFSSNPLLFSEPCQPQQLTVGGSCDNETLRLQWNNTSGALGYVVVAAGDLGYVTSFQSNVSTLEVKLPCGQRYNITVVGQDNRCTSLPSTPAYYTTAPCVPGGVESFVQCEDSIGAVGWARTEGAETYIVVARGLLGNNHMCSTNGTTCMLKDLVCGETYTVRVIAGDVRCSSAPSNSTVIHMAPCVPQKVVSSMDCGLRVASLTWSPSLSAQSYMVTAVASSGHLVALTTNDTSAQISELQCGLQYSLTVRAVNHWCKSALSNTSFLQTDPCPPSSVFTSVSCFSSIAVVSWSGSDTADHYTATAVGPNDEMQMCMSSGTSCSIATLQCGMTYLVTVTASNHLCSSVASQMTNLTTVPCIPTGVSVTRSCDRNEALVSWGPSQGALSYRALAQSRKNDTSSCESAGNVTSCVLRNLSCSTVYTVKVVSVGDQCSSLLSAASVFSTVPCKVTIGSVYLNCSTDSLLLNWTATAASVVYTAVARATSGQVSSCSTNFTSCEITQLACGQAYNVSVAASDGQCSSLQSAALQVASAPCHPVNVLSNINCSTQTAHVQWLSDGGVESYQVHVVGTRGHMAGCNTTRTSCDVHNLLCGDVYNVSVIATSNVCSVTKNAAAQLSSGPCSPDHLTTSLDCTSGAVTVSWWPSPGATSYTAVAHGRGGFPTSCTSNGTACVFAHLLCGLAYDFAVAATASNACSSGYGHSVALTTIPCQPQNVSAQMDCGNSTGMVSWEPGEGVSLYTVSAVAPDGHQTHCNSANSSCSLDSMLCGQRYDLNVTAQDSQCNSTAAYFSLKSVPCAPTGIQATLICNSNSVGVSWQRSGGALGYQAAGVSASKLHAVSCNSSLLHCDLQQLHCGTRYTVSVAAWDSVCSGSSSALTQVRTGEWLGRVYPWAVARMGMCEHARARMSTREHARAPPCPPQQVHAQVNCSANVVTVSWAANPDAESFHVDLATSASANLSCDTWNTSCSVGPLPCGVSYAITVRSVRAGCPSDPSRELQISSVPCIPEGEKGSLDCVTNSVWVSWKPTAGAEYYTVLAVAADGTNSTCSSNSLYCNAPQLQCGAAYTFRVTALNSQCSSAPSNSFQIETAPCALTGVTLQTECSSSSISVGWSTRAISPLYVVTALGQDNSFLECNSTDSSCVLAGVRCGMHYTVMVSTTSDKCNSLRSLPYTINTAPCAPENVTVKPVCEVAGVLVSWPPSALAESYSTTATGTDGDVHTCGGPAPNCSLSQLHCGRSYAISITAYAGNCSSTPSQAVTFHTTSHGITGNGRRANAGASTALSAAPCAPRDLAVVTDCTSVTATLSWSASEGSRSYIATAHRSNGDALQCSVLGTAGTSCGLAGLQCGETYNFSVQASDGTCTSAAGPPVQKGAVPCPPVLVAVVVHNDVDYSLVRVSWSHVTCPAVEYLVELTGSPQSDPLSFMNVSSYWTNRTYFEFPAPSDLAYAVTVRAGNQAGSSVQSAAVTGLAGPKTGRRRREIQKEEIWAVLYGGKDGYILPVPEIKVLHVNRGNLLHVEWTPVTEASHYVLIVKEDRGSLLQVLTVSENSSEVNDLQGCHRL